jgi:arsenate reductase (thioredoxin)
MRKQKVLFLCTQNSARSQMAEAFLREHGADRFEAYSAGCEVADEIHPYATEVMQEVGIDISDQHPKGLRTYMGKMGFNYSIIVCARAERNCPKTFPGVGTRLVWIFDDPRGGNVLEEERLEKFREVRDQIEQKILDWLEHPEEELAKLREERKLERLTRMETARWKAEVRAQKPTSRHAQQSHAWRYLRGEPRRLPLVEQFSELRTLRRRA